MHASNQLLQKIESAGLWSYFQKDWLIQIRERLHQQLPQGYRVFVESKAVIIVPVSFAPPSSTIIPDSFNNWIGLVH